MEQEAYRHVPYDIDVEQALLGAVLQDNRALERVSGNLKAEDFYDPLHGRIWDTMSACQRQAAPTNGLEVDREPVRRWPAARYPKMHGWPSESDHQA